MKSRFYRRSNGAAMADPRGESNGAHPPLDFARRLRLGFQTHANTDHAKCGRAVVADQPAREADQDRRRGREAWPLGDVPDGRRRRAAADVSNMQMFWRHSDVLQHEDVSEHRVADPATLPTFNNLWC